MKRTWYLSLLLAFALGGSLPGYGQTATSSAGEGSEPEQVSAPIYFRLGKSAVDPTFMDNRRQMELFVGTLREILSNPDYVVNRVRVVGMASPDGSRERNLELAGARARSLADFLIRETGISEEKIDVVNGGENWDGLFAMIEASKDIPDKAKMLELRDQYGEDYDGLKQSMRNYNGSRAWKFMYQHFFPTLRTGAGGADSGQKLSSLSITNWQRMRTIIERSQLDDATKRKALDIISEAEIDQKTDAQTVLHRLEGMIGARETYEELERQAVDEMLGEMSMLSSENWARLVELIAASDMPDKSEALRAIVDTPLRERDAQLRALNGGDTYKRIAEHLFPELFRSDRPVQGAGEDAPMTTLSAENWRMLRDMIEGSDMPDKEAALGIIDTESDPVVRERKLRELKEGYCYQYVKEVFFPELLYDMAPSARENWQLFENVIRESEFPNRNRVLEILDATPPGVEREKAIRALDDSRTWNRLGQMVFSELLQTTEDVESSGTGMSFTFEASPAAKARAEELRRQEEERRRLEEQRRLEEERRLAEERRLEEERRLAEERRLEEERRLAAEREAARQAAIEHRKLKASAALKTDFVLWGSLMPGFEMGSFMPNLSAEVYFAKRWSVQLGGGYSNWDALLGDKGLYAVTGVDLEPRFWLRDDALYRGLYFGVYGTYGDFDIQQSATGYTGTYFTGGVTGGWCQVLGRHLYLEAALRLGFRSATGDNYTIVKGYWEDFYVDGSESRGKFAPQVRLQLVYRFGKSGK